MTSKINLKRLCIPLECRLLISITTKRLPFFNGAVGKTAPTHAKLFLSIKNLHYVQVVKPTMISFKNSVGPTKHKILKIRLFKMPGVGGLEKTFKTCTSVVNVFKRRIRLRSTPTRLLNPKGF